MSAPPAPTANLERLAAAHGLLLCVQCGKCAAVCPMGSLFEDYRYETSPRGVIEHVLLGLEVREHPGLWCCLACDLCTDLCPAGVRFRDFVLETRRRGVEAGLRGHGAFCRGCDAYLWPLHTVEHLKRTLGEATQDLLTLCPRCRRHDHGRQMRALGPGGRGAARAAGEAS